MPSNTARKIDPHDDHAFDTLLQYTMVCADAVRPLLKSATIQSYKRFLNMMYHYTFDSERKCLHAAEQTDSPELRDYFLHMAKEERGHYLLAEKDLEGFGESVDKTTRPDAVKEFDDFWYGLGKKDPNEFTGALLVFEGIADQVGEEVVNLIARLDLNKKQSRWLRVHVEADHSHGAEAVAICKRYYMNNPTAMHDAAAEASRRWSEVFTTAFQD